VEGEAVSENEEFEFRLRLERERKPKEAPPIQGGVDPTSGMSTFDKAAAGVGKSIADVGLGIRSLLGQTQPGEVEESRRLDKPLMDTGAGFAGNVGGQIATALAPGGAVAGLGRLAGAAGAAKAGGALAGLGSSMMAPTTIKGAAALGAGLGAAQPAVDMGERAMNAGLGGAGGAGGQALFKGLARVVSPNTQPNALALMAEGVTPTPGQLLGGGFKRTEEALTNVPLLGQSIRNAQTRGIEDLNRAAINRSLKPVGEALPKGVTGREAIEFAQDALGKKYDALLPKLNTEIDGQFITELQSLRNMMGDGSIDPVMAQRFEAILQGQLLQKLPKDGPAVFTGQTMKGIESDLGRMASQFRTSPDPDQRMLGDAILEVQSILRGNVERANPQFAPELKAINEGYANFKRVQKAAAGVGAEDGVFTAAQLQSAVKALDKSKDKGKFAKGQALMQDLSDPAKAVLAPKVPDSGTPFRLASMGAAGGVAGGALGGLLSPGAVLGAAAAPVMYSRAGQNALAALLARRPEGAEQAANALRRLGPYAAIPAIGTSTQQR
jgi:hypothetical protein